MCASDSRAELAVSAAPLGLGGRGWGRGGDLLLPSGVSASLGGKALRTDGCGPGSGRGGSTWPGPPPLSCPDRRGSGPGVRGLLPCLPWIRVQAVRARPGKSLTWSSAFLATPWVSGEMRFHSASSNLDFSPWSSPANFVRCCFLS